MEFCNSINDCVANKCERVNDILNKEWYKIFRDPSFAKIIEERISSITSLIHTYKESLVLSYYFKVCCYWFFINTPIMFCKKRNK